MNNTWNYHDTQLKKLKQIYNKTSKQTQVHLQEIFDSFKIKFEDLYNIADNKTLSRVKTKIEEWKDKGLLTGYFEMLANNIYKKTRVKNSEILELLIYGAYIEEQSKLEETEKQIIYDDMNYYYQEEQKEVNKIQKKKKSISVLDMALFLYLIEQPNYSGLNLQQYIDVIIQNNAKQMYRQVLINIQQQRELDISLNEFQRIINQQSNQKLCINNERISGFMDMHMVGLNNQSKVQGIIEAIRKQLGKTREQIKSLLNKDLDIKVRFIAVEDDKTTLMCNSLDEQIFSINKINRFTRYYGETAKTLKKKKFKIKGLVLRYKYATDCWTFSLL